MTFRFPFRFSPAVFSALVLSIVVAGCASIIHGSSQDVSIASDPSGATVTINGVERGQTPITQSLKRKKTHTLTLALDGYETEELFIERKVSGWFWGNILFGGLIGIAIDAGTGAMYKLDPSTVDTMLSENTASRSARSGDGDVFITVVLEPSDDWTPIGQLSPSR